MATKKKAPAKKKATKKKKSLANVSVKAPRLAGLF
jgi:hypothetical protein